MTKAAIVPESLDKEVEHAIEEARMVLPGIQALFGFQLIVVFSARFTQLLPQLAQRIHLVSLLLTAIAIGLIMAPAAYHRQAERGIASRHFVNYASRLITIAMAPLLASICIEVGLVTWAVTADLRWSAAASVALGAPFAWLWFVVPRLRAQTTRRIQKHVLAHGPKNGESGLSAPTPLSARPMTDQKGNSLANSSGLTINTSQGR